MAVKVARREQFGRGPVRYKLEGPVEGPKSLSIAIAYNEAPVPDHYYFSDYFQVLNLDLEALLIFGKLDHPKMDRLRNKVEIYFPAHLFVRQLWKSSREFQNTVAGFVQKAGSHAVGPSSVASDTDKVQTLHSNNVLMVLSAGECIMDFFYLSAKELWIRPRNNEPMEIEALVRIITPPSHMLGFLQTCDAVAKEFIEKLGINVTGDDDEDLESD